MKEIEICDVYNDKGIYGIYSNDELLYIGKGIDEILPILEEIKKADRNTYIEPKKIRFVYPYKGKNANILLVEGAKNGKPGLKVMDPLYVYENSNYTEEIKKYFE